MALSQLLTPSRNERVHCQWSSCTRNQIRRMSGTPPTPYSIVLPPIITPKRTYPDFFSKPVPPLPSSKVDIVSYLPSEVAIMILLKLPASDLCRACQVCKKWKYLIQEECLSKRRASFVDTKRKEWQSEMENHCSSTPPSQASTQVCWPMVTGTSPLSSIQYSSLAQRKKSQPSPLSSILRTPSNYSSLLESVAKLNVFPEEDESEVKRCLFPEDLDDGMTPAIRPSTKIGSKASRNRLKRL